MVEPAVPAGCEPRHRKTRRGRRGSTSRQPTALAWCPRRARSLTRSPPRCRPRRITPV